METFGKRPRHTAALATLRQAGRLVLDSVWPPACLACGQATQHVGLCPACAADWDAGRIERGCRRCGRPRAVGAVNPCGGCATESFWNVRELACVGRYDGVLRDLLLQLKFSARPDVARWCGSALADEIARRPWADQIELIVPVPMHPLRRWQRAGNHAQQLAEQVARDLRRPLRRALRRTRMVPSQTRQTSRAARMRQVRDTFGPRRRSGVTGRCVCIIDNVLVSGATIHEVSRQLRRCGARRIYAAVVGRR